MAAVYTIFDSLAYIGFTAMGLVTAGVAVASFREHAFSRAVGWLSAIGTGLFVCAVGCVNSVVHHKTFDLQARPSLRTP